MTIELRPEIAAALETLAAAKGLSVEEYLEQLVERELPAEWCRRGRLRRERDGARKWALGLPHRKAAADPSRG